MILGAALVSPINDLVSIVSDAVPSSGTSSSHDILIGTIFTGIITLILGVVTAILTRSRSSATPPTIAPGDARPERIRDLQKQRDDWKRRYEIEAAIAQDLETMCWEHQLNPSAIIKRRTGGR